MAKRKKKLNILLGRSDSKDVNISPLLVNPVPEIVPRDYTETYPIWVGPTRVCIPCTQSGRLWNTTFDIFPLVQAFREYKKDHYRNKMVVSNQHAIYDSSNLAIFPRHALEIILDKLGSLYGVRNTTIVPLPEYQVRQANINLREGITPRDYQVEFIDYLVEEDNRFALLELGCGEGKTFISTNAIVRRNAVPLIITSGLVEQWTKEFMDKTDATRNDIFIIQGRKSIEFLQEADGFNPKVFIASTRTISTYALAHSAKSMRDSTNVYRHYMRLGDLMAKYGVGIKVIDEVHENFAANTAIDMAVDIPRNIYLSATYLRSDSISNRIFSVVYPEEMRYGKHRKKKYLNITTLGYTFGDEFPVDKCMTNDGYNHYRYEAIVLKNRDYRRLFLDAITYTTIKQYYLGYRTSSNQRCMIICGTTNMVDAIYSYIKSHYPELKSIVFYGSDQEIDEDVQVIVSTLKKSSTGRDIKRLKVLANTVSFSARNIAEQLPGRQRYIHGEELYYLDFFNRDLETHQRHVSARSFKYRDIGKRYCSRDL